MGVYFRRYRRFAPLLSYCVGYVVLITAATTLLLQAIFP